MKHCYKIDVQNDKKCVYYPPTSYKTGTGEIFEYKWVKFGPLLDLPAEILTYLKGLSASRPKTQNAGDREAYQSNVSRLTSKEKSAGNRETSGGEFWVLLLTLVGASDFKDTYSDWFKLICACRSCGERAVGGESVEWWKEAAWERLCTCERSEFEKKWDDSIKYSKKYSEATIKHYGRASNEEEYTKLIRVHQKLDGKMTLDETDLRDYFLDTWGDNILCFKRQPKMFYVWRGGRWHEDDGSAIRYELIEQLKNLLRASMQRAVDGLQQMQQELARVVSEDGDEELKTRFEKLIKDAKKQCCQADKAYKQYGAVHNKQVFSLVCDYLRANAHERDIFDEQREVFAFTNKCFNLCTKEWFVPSKFDYILTTCNKEWREPTDVECARVGQLWKDVFPDKELRKCFASVQFGGLSGFRHEQFFFLIGIGRNGKGVCGEMLSFLLGDYSAPGHLTLLTKPMKEGANQELRSLHKKRHVIYSEPEDATSEKMRINNIKKLTGNEEHNARGLYEKDCTTRIFATQVCECNELPALMGKKDHAIADRLVLIPFETTFTEDKALLREDSVKYRPMDKTLKSPEFKERHFCAWFKYLVDNATQGCTDLYLPDKTKKLALAYLEEEDDFASWFKEHFERVDGEKVPGEIIPRKYFLPTKATYDMYFEEVLKFESKEIQRKNKWEKFENGLVNSPFLRLDFRDTRKEGKVHVWQKGNTYEFQQQNTKRGLVHWRPCSQSH